MSSFGNGVPGSTGIGAAVSGTIAPILPPRAGRGVGGFLRRVAGALQLIGCTILAFSLLSWSTVDPSLTHVASGAVRNWMGPVGAIVSDLLVQLLGVASIVAVLPPAYWALQLATQGYLPNPKRKLVFAPLAVIGLAVALSSLPDFTGWPLRHGYGGAVGDVFQNRLTALLSIVNATRAGLASGVLGFAIGLFCLQRSFGLSRAEMKAVFQFEKKSNSTAPTTSHQPRTYAPRNPEATGFRPQQPAAYQHTPMAASAAPAWDANNHPHQHSWSPPHDLRPVSPRSKFNESYTHGVLPTSFVPPPSRHQTGFEAPTPGPARQAWLRPMHRRSAIVDGAPAPATDRRHAPAFDQETDHQSRAIAERFAPSQVELTSHPLAGKIEPILEPIPTVMAEPPQVFAAAIEHRTQIIMPQRAEPSIAGHSPIVAPGGFFARITGGHRSVDTQHYKRPSLTLLNRPPVPAHNPEITSAKLRERSQLLLETLGDFGIKGEIIAVRPGPVVTLFEFEPARGTKSSRVIGLADDVARSMSARAVRIAVVPGVNAIGIELPNATREPVGFRDLLEHDHFRNSDAKLPLALGKGIGGNPVVADLARMPHLLVAGTTGSGKSVGVNAMILSLLYQLSPADCRLILIDPKMLELSVYNGIPHLLTPVVTDPNKAIAALNWAVGEMENRYRRMSALSVRNIEVYNTRVRGATHSDVPRDGKTTADHAPMPHIVIVVDEFADLMAVAGKEIEFAVQRLAQMARAAGIHLIMATQRPSVDIITGTIKANFPTRISFRVTSRIDSRTILNEQGAEQLLGQGDMLYAGGSGQIMRVHGPFVSDEEVESIANHLRALGPPAYVEGITDTPELEQAASTPDAQDDDHLYDRAVSLVRADHKASISYLQRKLSIGYNRAAGIIERMEHDGLVSQPSAAGKREVLTTTDAEPPTSPVTDRP